jgi:hypothetical protein
VTPVANPPAPATGAIHDLGYKRYVGTRLATSTRWRVIMRHQIAMAWKTWWRFKSTIGLAVIVSVIAGGFMYFATNKIFHGLGGAGEVVLKMGDAVLPLSVVWYCRVAFVLSLTLGAGVIAGDVQSGAFTFYFARSVRPVDYVLGKLAGLSFLVGSLVIIGPLLLAALRLGLSEDTDQLVTNLVIVPKVVCIGALATIAYAAVPLGFSALIPNKRYALAAWAAYYLVIGFIVKIVGLTSSASWIGAFDLPTAIDAVTLDLFDLHPITGHHGEISLTAALGGIGAHVVAAITVIGYQVSRAQKTGVGGQT